MARTGDEVILGVGTLYTAPNTGTAEARPTNPDTSVGGNFVEVGYSEQGWTLQIDKTFEDIIVAEEVDPIDVAKTAQIARLVGELAQASLTNFALAMGGGTISASTPSAGYTRWTPPTTTTFAYKTLLLRVNAPKVSAVYQPRDIYMPKCAAVGAISYASQKAPQKSLLAVEFRVIKAAGVDLFDITDAVT